MKNILAFIDAPDPDNFVMLAALNHFFQDATLHVILTGRPVRFNATRDHATWEWDDESSRMAQQASALRIKNFMRHFGMHIPRVYDGGIAPRTLVPHWVHFEEYYKFLDADPLAALRYSELDPQEDLVKLMLEMDECHVVVGGPMTGLAQVLVRNPAVADKIQEVHAMFATWGNVELMQMSDDAPPRGAKQFNVACDPVSAHIVLNGLRCPIYLMPTEVTRVSEIGFQNAQALRKAIGDSAGASALYHLYALWYDAAIRPRQAKNPNELIFIHDLVGAFSLATELRRAIYDVVSIEQPTVPHLPFEHDDWGTVLMQPTNQETTWFAARGLNEGGAGMYLQLLREICH